MALQVMRGDVFLCVYLCGFLVFATENESGKKKEECDGVIEKAQESNEIGKYFHYDFFTHKDGLAGS